jgi:hypothetical protein
MIREDRGSSTENPGVERLSNEKSAQQHFAVKKRIINNIFLEGYTPRKHPWQTDFTVRTVRNVIKIVCYK